MKTVTYKFIMKFAMVFLILVHLPAQAAPKAELLPFWDKSDELNKTPIDHSAWQKFIDTYVQQGKDGFNLIKYAQVSPYDKKLLDQYISYLSKITIRSHRRAEQFAYWVNLYNASTVKLILDNYPVKSITKLGSSFFSFGPWDDQILTIEEQKISLNNIEHGILRPIWQDKRIHYVVNCASIGCPELAKTALTADNYENILVQAEKDYILHKRGFRINQGVVTLSKIYEWYQVDFADNVQQLVRSFKPFFPDEEDSDELDSWLTLSKSYQKVEYEYDWSLNEF